MQQRSHLKSVRHKLVLHDPQSEFHDKKSWFQDTKRCTRGIHAILHTHYLTFFQSVYHHVQYVVSINVFCESNKLSAHNRHPLLTSHMRASEVKSGMSYDWKISWLHCAHLECNYTEEARQHPYKWSVLYSSKRYIITQVGVPAQSYGICILQAARLHQYQQYTVAVSWY